MNPSTDAIKWLKANPNLKPTDVSLQWETNGIWAVHITCVRPNRDGEFHYDTRVSGYDVIENALKCAHTLMEPITTEHSLDIAVEAVVASRGALGDTGN